LTDKNEIISTWYRPHNLDGHNWKVPQG